MTRKSLGVGRSALDTDVAERLGAAVNRLQRRLRRADAEGASALPPARRAVLALLEDNLESGEPGAMTAGALASAEQVSPPTMTKVIQALEEAGYVKRRRDDLDRRAIHIAITQKGKMALRAARSAQRDELKAMIQTLSKNAVRVLGESAEVIDDLVKPRQVP